MKNYQPNENLVNVHRGIVDEVPIYKFKFMEFLTMFLRF